MEVHDGGPAVRRFTGEGGGRRCAVCGTQAAGTQMTAGALFRRTGHPAEQPQH